MKRILFVALIASLLYFFYREGLLFGTPKFTHSIQIQGDNRYASQVVRCLDLLAHKAPDDYQLIEKHVGIIAQHEKSGMRAWENPPRYEMSNKTAFHSLTWCSGTIAHDAYHSYLYRLHQPPTGEKTPYEKWGGFDAERQAIRFQLAVMEKIGAPNNEIDHLRKQDGKHGDINKDGKLDKEDYRLRNW